jgi:Protein of unknown function (DUF2795)
VIYPAWPFELLVYGKAPCVHQGTPGFPRSPGPWKEFAMGLADFIKVYRFLRGIRYPATKQQLVAQARSNQADQDALDSLRGMPEREYSGPDEVSRVIAGD